VCCVKFAIFLADMFIMLMIRCWSSYLNSSAVCHVSGDNDRDIFNEKPSKEELISATQVSQSQVIIPLCNFSLVSFSEFGCVVLCRKAET